MSGNAPDGLIRYDGRLLRGGENDFSCCDVCGGHLPDHDWADLDPSGTVVDCSEQTR